MNNTNDDVRGSIEMYACNSMTPVNIDIATLEKTLLTVHKALKQTKNEKEIIYNYDVILVPLPTIEHEVLVYIMKFATFQTHEALLSDIWEIEYFSYLMNNQEFLVKVLQAANFLEYENLLLFLGKNIAEYIKAIT